ncbi:MAG: hypothetical protein K2X82_04690 [Gemmataceae bacterium]|nr:hypothetical protein [Gemmataceae bacterium]
MPCDPIAAALQPQIASAVAEGFDDRDDLIDNFTNLTVEEHGRDDLGPLVTGLVDAALAAHARRQARWPAVTDCDRLDRAFEALEEQGVVARQHFSCCSNCGEAEIGGEIAAAEDDGREVVGYAFYHQQDTQRAAEGGGIYVKYGPNTDGPETAAIGRMIVAAVEAAGLKAEWDGSPNNAVLVRLKWRKRRADGEPAGE